MWWGALVSGVSSLSLRTVVPSWGPTLMTSSKSNNPLKDPFPTATHWGLGFTPRIWGDVNIQSIAVCDSVKGFSILSHQEKALERSLHFHFSLSYFGEGNGNLLQYSRLENPRDRGAWWAAIYGVTQSQT